MARPVHGELFRRALAGVCTPVTVVTTYEAGRPYGTTVSAFSSLSLDPPLVLVSLARTSDLLAALERTSRFGVNVLAQPQQDLAVKFSRKGPGKFDGAAWSISEGVPRLDGAGSWLACRCDGRVAAGDHVITIGLVEHVETVPSEPLLYRNRAFGTLRLFDS